MENRKSKKNLVQTPQTEPVGAGSAVLLAERLLKRLLETALGRMLADRSVAERYFSHFFDTTMSGVQERDAFLNAFLKTPPKVVLSYPRSGASMPCFSIVLESEEESDSFLADFANQEDDEEHLGAFFEATYSVIVYASQPDMTQVLYQLAKGIIHAGKEFLLHEGVMEVSLSGGDLSPDENYMPENLFLRALRVRMKTPYTAPFFLPTDPRKLKVLVYASDVAVDGLQGTVQTVILPDETT